MATQLENFAFVGAGRKRKYQWDLWLDGNIWKLTRPDDFQCNVNSLRNGAMQASRHRGLKVRTTIVDDDTIVIQAYEDVLHEFNAQPF